MSGGSHVDRSGYQSRARGARSYAVAVRARAVRHPTGAFRWEKGTAEPSIDMIRLISTRFEVPMARLMEMPDNGFCQSCAMPFYRPEDHGTEPDGTRNGDYCNYCYEDGVFLQPMPIAMNWSPRVRR